MQRRQVVKEYFVRQFIRVLSIDRFDSQQRKVAFVLFRRTNLTSHGRSGTKPKATNLAGADINVIRTWQIVIVLLRDRNQVFH